MANIKKQDKDSKEEAIKRVLINSLTIYHPEQSGFLLSSITSVSQGNAVNAVYQNYHQDMVCLVEELFEIVELVEKIIKDDTPHFKLVDTENKSKPKTIKGTALGKQLLQLLEHQTIQIHHYLDEVNTHPYLQLWLDATKKVRIETLQKETEDNKGNVETYFASLEQVINTIRERAKQSINKKSLNLAIKDRRDTVQKNYRKLAEYITYLLALFPQLQIARVELNYKPTLPTKMLDPNIVMAPQFSGDCYLEAKQHRKAFFKELKNSKKFTYAEQLVGFAWKLKYTPVKKFYYELLLFFNSKDIDLHRPLQTLWWLITNNKDSFQCQIIQQDKKNKADHTREKQQEIKAFLEQAMISLTLTDKYVYYTPASDKPSHDKTFDKGKPSVYYRTRLLNKVKRITSTKKSR